MQVSDLEIIECLESAQNRGEFDGQPEQDMVFKTLDQEDLVWYWVNWIEPNLDSEE